MAPRGAYVRRASAPAPLRHAPPRPRGVVLSPTEVLAIAALCADPDELEGLLLEQGGRTSALGQVALGYLVAQKILEK